MADSREPNEPPERRRGGGRSVPASDETRLRIVEATLETIRSGGIVGTSARAIARTGGFNQASIYYHFGSINDAVLAAIAHLSTEQLDRYRDRLDGVTTLPELVTVARALHEEDGISGALRVLAQVMAGAAGDDAFGTAVAKVFDPWIDVVTGALGRVLGSSPLRTMLPVDELAYAVSALFVGIEMLAALRPQDPRSEMLFTAFSGLAGAFDGLLRPGSGGLAEAANAATP